MPIFSLRTFNAVLPALLLTTCFLAINPLTELSSQWLYAVTLALPILFFCTAFLLSLQFNRSRLSYALLFIGFNALLLLAETLPPSFSWLLTLLNHVSANQLLALQILFSINLFIFSQFKDRGFFSIHSILRLLFITTQFAALQALDLQQLSTSIYAAISSHLPSFIPSALISILSPQTPALLLTAFALALSLHIVSLLLRKNTGDGTFIGLQCTLISFHLHSQAELFIPILIIAAALIVIVSILADSHAMAYKDELTGLPSRRALTQLQLSLGRKYTIAMLDIDFFKKFNDTHGHDIGDEVLKMVAAQIAKVGGGGRAFRYGGEEFTVVFPGKDPEYAQLHCDKLRENIQNYEMHLRTPQRPKKSEKSAKNKAKRSKNSSKQQCLSVTISIGLAQRNGQLKTPVQVMKGADQALYRAKNKGRNCVMT